MSEAGDWVPPARNSSTREALVKTQEARQCRPHITRCRTSRLNKGNASATRRGVLAYLRNVTTAQPFFTIVMASYLGDYSGRYGTSATDRVAKFHRAIASAQAQRMPDWELVIVADGCEITEREWKRCTDERVRCLLIPKQRLWSEKVRNAGIHAARGRYIVYLDTDDMLADDHLQVMRTKLIEAGLPSWACFPDQVWDQASGAWLHRVCRPYRRGAIGTSNIAHVGGDAVYWPTIEYRWPENGYDHDWQFARSLVKSLGPPVVLDSGGYQVCHIPKHYDI